MSQVKFKSGDVLVLQASDESPLLVMPPLDFYKGGSEKKGLSAHSLSHFVKKRIGSFGSLSDARSEKSNGSGQSKTTTSRQRSDSQENFIEETPGNGEKKFEFFVSESDDEVSLAENLK